MMARRFTPWLALALLSLGPRPAQAQTYEMPEHAEPSRVALGGEVGLFMAPADDHTYFNYTSYDVDALRTARLRLFGEWHVRDRLSFIGEVRAENGDAISAAAFYVRWRPTGVRNLTIQAGRIPPVIGAYPRRAYGRDNAVLGMPLAYQYLTSLRPDAVPETLGDVLRMQGRGWRPSFPVGSSTVRPGVPLVNASSWDTGAEATWSRRWLEVSGALTQGSPADPVIRDRNHSLMWSGRVATPLPHGVTVGLSGARAGWLEDAVLDVLPQGRHTPSAQTLVGADVEFGVGSWLIRAEWLHAAFDVPLASAPDASTLSANSGFVEGRYRPHPRVQIGFRLDRIGFSAVTDPTTGLLTSWDANVNRAEVSVGLRLTRALDLRAGWQQNWRLGTSTTTRRGTPAVGLLYWF